LNALKSPPPKANGSNTNYNRIIDSNDFIDEDEDPGLTEAIVASLLTPD